MGSAYGLLDAGHNVSQLNFWAAYPDPSPDNTATYRVTLPEAVHIQTLRHQYYGLGETPLQYRVLGSTTGFGSLTELVPWTTFTGATTTDTLNTTLQYLQYEFLGTKQWYVRFNELQAYPASGAVIDLTGGYNLLAQRSTATIHSASPWTDAPAGAIDLNVNTYLRNQVGTINPWFIIDLWQEYTLTGAAAGFYHGQSWSDMTIEVSVDDPSLNNWTTAYVHGGTIYGATMPFPGEFAARYVRVSTPTAGSGGALCEFELYAVPTEEPIVIPEPASVSLLVLGAAGVLARRRRKAWRSRRR